MSERVIYLHASSPAGIDEALEALEQSVHDFDKDWGETGTMTGSLTVFREGAVWHAIQPMRCSRS